MLDGPVAFGVQKGVEVGAGIVQNLVRRKVVKAQQPVRLIEPVLPQQGRGRVQSGQAAVLRHGDIGGVEHPLELVFLVKTLGEL